MSDFQAIVAGYIDTWNERDPAARRAAIDKLWTEDARYVDPLVDVRGRAAIDSTIAAVQERFPDFAFRVAGPVDGHHGQCRFSWELGPENGAAPVAGSDVALIDGQGTLQTVLGFLDRVPAT